MVNRINYIKKRSIKLSVIVPVYNVEPYINRCVDSIINQTYKDLEIILVDDGSTDKSGMICDEYAIKDSRIRVIHKENGGIVSARKAGILNATGEYTTDVDSDDWIEKEAYSYMIQIIKQFEPDMLALGHKKQYTNGVIGKYRQALSEGMFQGRKFVEEFNNCLDKMNFLCAPVNEVLWNKVIKTNIRKKYQLCVPDILQKCEDNAVVIPCLLNVDSIYIDSNCFYHYCVRKNSVVWENQSEEYSFILVLSKYLIDLNNVAKNKGKIKVDYILYQLFYLLMLYNPEKLITNDGCSIFPQVKSGSNIIVYGRGAFATRLIKGLKDLQYCNIIDNIDSEDIERICLADLEKCDYIVIAIFSSEIVCSTILKLEKMGVQKNKIAIIQKEKLTVDLLPKEIAKMWNIFCKEYYA